MGNPEKNRDGKDKPTGRDRSLANLKPFKPGNDGNGGGRPKGSRNLTTILKEHLRLKFKASATIKDLNGKRNDEAWAAATVHRAILRGGFDSNIVLERVEGKVPDRMIEMPSDDPLAGYSEDDKALLAQMAIKRLRRLNGKK